MRDIKQKRLLGSNLTKKFSDLLSFSLIFYFFTFNFMFVILLYSFSFISTLRTMLCLKCGGIWRVFFFLCCLYVKIFLCFFHLKYYILSLELPLIYENMNIM